VDDALDGVGGEAVVGTGRLPGGGATFPGAGPGDAEAVADSGGIVPAGAASAPEVPDVDGAPSSTSVAPGVDGAAVVPLSGPAPPGGSDFPQPAQHHSSAVKLRTVSRRGMSKLPANPGETDSILSACG